MMSNTSTGIGARRTVRVFSVLRIAYRRESVLMMMLSAPFGGDSGTDKTVHEELC